MKETPSSPKLFSERIKNFRVVLIERPYESQSAPSLPI
jgi:hypothetical protein